MEKIGENELTELTELTELVFLPGEEGYKVLHSCWLQEHPAWVAVPHATVVYAGCHRFLECWEMSAADCTLTFHLYTYQDPKQGHPSSKRPSGIYWIENPPDPGTLIGFTELLPEDRIILESLFYLPSNQFLRLAISDGHWRTVCLCVVMDDAAEVPQCECACLMR